MRRPRRLIGPAGMGGMVGLWGASSLIKSIQYGTTVATVAGTATATITAVDTANSVIQFLGSSSNSALNGGHWAGYCKLTNATTVTTTYQAVTDTRTLSFCVIEYLPGVIKSKQSVTISCLFVASNTATITSVNTAKTMISNGGISMYLGAMDEPSRLTLTNATTVTMNRGGTSGYQTDHVGDVVEFF